MPAGGVEVHMGDAGFDMVHDCECRGQGGMPAEVYLSAGREPYEPVPPVTAYSESGLRQVVLDGQFEHDVIRQPAVRYADGRGIALEDGVREGIYLVESHGRS